MTIKYPETFVNNLWDWGFLDECFAPTRIRVTDMDGLVERNGHFLLIETKSPAVPIPMGQQILFDRLVQDVRWNVLIIWGKANAPEKMTIMGAWGHQTSAADENTVKDIVRRWFNYADDKRGF